MAKLQHEFEEYLDEDGHIVIKINPIDYIMSRIFDSGIVGDGNYIYFDDLKKVLGEILRFDNMEECNNEK